MNRTSLLIAALAFALAGCSSVSSWFDSSSKAPPVDPNAFPADYKKEIINTMLTLVDEPPKVRDSFVTDPALRTAGAEQRYVVCVRTSARNASGQFEPPKDRIGYFYGGHLNQLVDATPEQCGNAAYKPFPELDHMCAGKSCERGG